MNLKLPDPFVAKIWLGGIGLAVGVMGMALERRWLVWVAVGLLAAAFSVRFLDPPRARRD